MARRKDPAAVALGRRGGARQVPKGFATMNKKRARQLAAAGGAAGGIPTACPICGEEQTSRRKAHAHCLNKPVGSWRD